MSGRSSYFWTIIIVFFLSSCSNPDGFVDSTSEVIPAPISPDPAIKPTIKAPTLQSPTTTVSPIPTSTPTMPPFSLLDIDLSEMLIVEGDLPERFRAGSYMHPSPPDSILYWVNDDNWPDKNPDYVYGVGIVDADAVEDIPSDGIVGVWVYEDTKFLDDIYRAFTVNWEIPSELNVAEISKGNFFENPSSDSYYGEMVFIRCHSVVYISGPLSSVEFISFSSRLSERISKLTCP